ncbi:MAG TPA: FkbM family methyltransferase [Polyangiaceae bacterium]|nr:FkbM family methyltransferase [Polyangiaceae bacterium]
MDFPTVKELRTLVANRLLGGTRVLSAASALKWALFPTLARYAPRVAIWCHEPESTKAFWDRLGPGMTVVDGGSNRGGYAMLASLRVGPTGRVFAFEPEPRNFERLERRLRRFPNVTAVRQAITGTNGSARLNLDTFHAGHSLVRQPATGSSSMSVPTTTLDAFVQQKALAGIDVLKLDIEGSELEAVPGMAGLLGGARRPVILCEVHAPITPEQMALALRPFEYECKLLDARMTGKPHEAPVHLMACPSPLRP